ncbi:NAD(P)/FAD-dependent oxidoreductase [soil metagenome]
MTENDSPDALAAAWLTRFQDALESDDEHAVAATFVEDSYWRDVMALTWDIGWTGTDTAIAERFLSTARQMHPRDFAISERHTPPRRVTRLTREVIEAFFTFTTDVGKGVGVVRLVPDESAPGGYAAWTILTTIKELRGFEDQPPAVRRDDIGFDRRSNPGLTWESYRNRESTFEDRDPEVMVVGGGHSGQMIAARLKHLSVDTLVVDRHPRVGDNWRTRYSTLSLHNVTDVVHMPYMPFPATFPAYLPKDKLAGWLEAYAYAMDLNYWPSTEFLGGTYDESSGRWTVTLRTADGSTRTMRPAHIVLATGGFAGRPRIPDLPGLSSFAGEVVHTHAFTSGADYAGRRVLVLGAATSAHDVALDLYNHGAEVTLMQRSPTMVISLETANRPYGQYTDGTPLEEADLVGAINFIFPPLRDALQQAVHDDLERDHDLLEGLKAAGMRIDMGADGAGWMLKYFRQNGGYYIDVGCSPVITAGGIAIEQYDDVETFVDRGVEHKDGTVEEFDTIVLATGYLNQQVEVRDFFGDEVADKVGPIMGYDSGYELRNDWRPTAQRGLWFCAGGFAQVRSYSRYLAIAIKADLLGITQRSAESAGVSSTSS